MRQIEVKNCSYTYQPGTINSHQALYDVNLSIEAGELLAIIGHGGSGKSTLALLLAGLFVPDSGTVTVGEGKTPPEEMFRHVGLVFQYPEHQLFAQSIFDEVAFGARNAGVAEEQLPSQVRKALEEVGLDPQRYWKQSPFELSGGQKRRVCIASLLAIDPQIVILDEPTAGLDAAGKQWMRELIASLNREGKTVIWISHDMSEVAELAQRVVVLSKGRVLLDGDTQTVFSCEQELNSAGLEIPQAARLVRELKAKGLPLPGRAVTVSGAFQELISYLGGERDD